MFEQIASTNPCGPISNLCIHSNTAKHNAFEGTHAGFTYDNNVNASANFIRQFKISKEQLILTVSSYMAYVQEDTNIKSHNINYRKYLTREDYIFHSKDI